jgi:hypothetical protein
MRSGCNSLPLQTYNGLTRGVKFSFDWELLFDPRLSNAYIKVSLNVGGKYVSQDIEGRIKLTDTEVLWTPVHVPLESSGFSERKSYKGTYEVPVFGTPDNGTIQVRFYHPLYSEGTGGQIDLFVDQVRVEPYVAQSVKKMLIEGKNPGYNTVTPFERTLHHGSGIPQCESLVSLADFSPTDLWHDGSLLQEYTLRQILTQHTYPTRVLSGTLTRPNPIGVVRDPDMASARFGVDGYVLDHRSGLAQITALELFGGPEEAPPLFGFYTEDEKPIHTENYHYITLKV